MVKLAFAALFAVALAGCSNHCSDGTSGMGLGIGPVSMSSNRYNPCHDECMDPVDPKPCGCSRACPCWAKHQ